MKAGVYARYSSDNQRDESIDAQLRAIEEYAKSNSIEIVKIYVDRAKSATTSKRPEFQHMIKDSALGIFDTIIVHKLDRFSRDRYDSAVYKQKLKQNGIKLISVVEKLDGSPESLILESVIEGMAQYYSANLSREVMKGLKETAYQSKHAGGCPPLGYELNEDKTYRMNPNEAKAVKRIFEMYVDGYTNREIIEEVNLMGVRTKSNKSFSKNSISSILKNEKYTGVYIFNRTFKKDPNGKRNTNKSKPEDEIIRIEGGMPAIIDKETYQKAQQLMKSRNKGNGANKATVNYLLSGLIKCGECGYGMYGNKRTNTRGNEYISYRCGGRNKKHICDNYEIRKEYIEEFVLTELERKILNDRNIPVLVKKLNEYLTNKNNTIKDETELYQQELETVEKQINNIVSAISSGLAYSSLTEKLSELEEKRIS
ncbi:recombinase family protein [Clostridium sp. ZS1]|uniref:recombinase family protein n=1 Tax=Clostridium sp. ZS1 TaxID=2949989 RepID=UPI00207A9B76